MNTFQGELGKMTAATIRKRRDNKALSHLEQYAPVWLEHEEIVDDDAILFNVVFRHPEYGWVSRRYKYDSFNDVLYHKGQRTLSEEGTLAIQETEPYVNVTRSDLPNSYGG